jgi:hypothetical protein
MKHVILSHAWEFGAEPFPAYRVNLVYGRNKQDREFLPVKDVTPITGEKDSVPTLPDEKFRVIKTREKGTILVVSGEDITPRCLLFVGCEGDFRGGVSVVAEATTGTILKQASAGNACQSSTEVIILMEVGQTVAFHTSGRYSNEVRLYTWDGSQVMRTDFTISEWQARQVVAAPPEDAEVL